MKTSRQLSQIFSDSSSLSPKVLFSSIIADITHRGQDDQPRTRHLLYASSALHKLASYDKWASCVEDMLYDPLVLQMNQFTQHHGTPTYVHCCAVSYYSFIIAKRLGLDARSVARAGMVHDLYLYDWRKREGANPADHTLRHPQVALANAERRFELNDTERECIRMHMWPAAPGIPQHPETYVISTVDKYCACLEATGAYHSIQQLRTRKIAAGRAVVMQPVSPAVAASN